MTRGQYNQIANYVVAQSEINIAIGKKDPATYFQQLLEQCNGGKKRYGNITDIDELQENLTMNCIPENMDRIDFEGYRSFLEERRKLMARKIKKYFAEL